MENKTIQPADRLNNVAEYYFATKLKEIANLKAQGKDIISLGIGSPDLPPSPATIKTLCEEAQKDDAHGYQPYVGLQELRQAYADWYERSFGVELNPNTEILPLIGSKEAILHVSMAFLNVGDGVLIPNPGYPTYTSISKLLGASIHQYDLDENNSWEPNFDELEKLDLSNIKLMWVNYPNMPTGARGSKDLLKRLVAFGKKHGIVIVNDNPYSFILNEERLSILQIEGAKDICIELNSLSKSHNMPGWRMGMLASNPQFVQWVLRVKSNVDSGQYKPMQLATVQALSNDQEWHREMNIEVYKKRRNYAEQIMTVLGCTFDKNQVGMFLWGRISDKYESGEKLADAILYGADVFLTPGFIFGSKGERYIRISLCASEKNLAEALNRIENLIQK